MGLLDFLLDAQARRDIGANARNLAQSASNAVAGNVTGPVDLLAAGMGALGVPIGDRPFGGSAWARQHGLLGDVAPGPSAVAGETLGLLGPIAAVAKAPSIAQGLLAAGERLPATSASRAMPANQRGSVGAGYSTPDASSEFLSQQAEKARAAGFMPGFYQGGQAPKGNRATSSWFSNQDAADYSRAIAEKHGGDFREYALRKGMYLDMNRGYPPRLLSDLADKVERDGSKKVAAMFRQYAGDGTPISGLEVWRGLETNLGVGAPEKYLSELGFSGALNRKRTGFAEVFSGTPVRDMSRAKFDPAHASSLDVTAGVLAPLFGLGLLAKSPGDQSE